MLRVHAFEAIRPSADKAQRVASLPYDVMNSEEAREMAKGNEDSFLHVTKPEIDLDPGVDLYSDVVYHTAKQNLDQLMARKVLIREKQPAIYLYRQIWEGHAQVGIVACAHIDDYAEAKIKRHEFTRKAKEDDRTRHVKETNVNAGPVFLAYRDDATLEALMKGDLKSQPLYDFVSDDGIQHTVWKVADCAAYSRAFESIDAAYIADGHHRAASAYRAGKERREALGVNATPGAEYEHFLAVYFPASQLCILPYNRLLKDLNGRSASDLLGELRELGTLEETQDPTPKSSGCFCFYLDQKWYHLALKPELIDTEDPVQSLDVALLQRLVLEPLFGIDDPRTSERIDFVGGIRGTAELEKRVNSGEMQFAVSMYPTQIEQLLRVADANEVMPPKSTWFEPKLRSGLLIHSLD